MSNYESFAKVYDVMMQDIPYDEWVKYIEAILLKYNCSAKMILDLGCGTGTVTKLLAQKGFEMIGVDLSEEMLMIAREKTKQENLDILYLCQDMVDLELYGTVSCAISLCDSLNYITEEEKLLEVFKKVNNYLDPGGLFVFDMNTEYKFEIMGENTFAQSFDDCAYIWDNYYDEDEKTNEYMLTLFIENNGQYDRFEESHYEKAYDIQKVSEILELAGLKLEAVFDELNFNPPQKNSERVYYVAREQEKLRRIK